MPQYGRNFEMRVTPPPDQRGGRYINGATRIPIGAPVVAGAVNADGRSAVALAAGDIKPLPGIHGIVIYEHAYAAFSGVDPFLTMPADLDYVPANAPCQLISGTESKVVLRNTAADEFLTADNVLAAKNFVAPANLATLAVGDRLQPHAAGTDTVGYWVEAVTAANAWLIITAVDVARLEVEARLAF